MKKTLLPRASFGMILEDLLFIIRVTYMSMFIDYNEAENIRDNIEENIFE